MDIELRRATPADAADLTAFNALAFAQNPNFDPDILVDWVKSDSASSYFTQIVQSENYCTLAFRGSELVGYLSTEPTTHPHRKSRYLEIVNLGVHPDHRRVGIASLLLHACEQWAKQRGFTRLELTCYRENSVALAYYEQVGFEPVHVTLEKDL